MKQVRIKRVYEDPENKDGLRVLVDRLWPRGLSKEKAAIDEWAREIAPSNELRKWFHSGKGTWSEFEKRYRKELKENPESGGFIKKLQKEKLVTLLYATRSEEQNHASILKSIIEKKPAR